MTRIGLTTCLLCCAFCLVAQVNTKELESKLQEVDSIISLGMLDEAEDMLKSLLKQQPQESAYRVRYGSVLIQKDDSTGITHLEKVIAQHPDHLFARKEAGRFYMMQGVRANSRLERAVASEDKNTDVLRSKRDAALKQMSGHYEHVIHLDSTDALTLKALMNVYGLLQDEKNYNRIVQLIEALKNH